MSSSTNSTLLLPVLLLLELLLLLLLYFSVSFLIVTSKSTRYLTVTLAKAFCGCKINNNPPFFFPSGPAGEGGRAG